MGRNYEIQRMSFLFYRFCFRSKLRQDYRSKLDKAAAQIERGLDLGRFIRRQRQQTIAILSLLTSSQAHLVTKMSKLTVGEDGPVASKFSDGTSCSAEQSDQKTKAINADHFVQQVLKSTDKVDRRILQLLNVQKKSTAVN